MIKTVRQSIVECNGRERAKQLLDNGTFHELIGPFDGIESPHLEPQGIVPQSDDGVIIAKGTLNGHPVVVISIEGNFQGGGIGEVSGAKVSSTLEMARKDCENGVKTIPIILFDSGGVRLQEANYGLLSIAEIGAAIVAIRKYVPVVGVIPGNIGAFGGMSITAGLCSALIMTRQGRLGLNGPEVIEQEAGVREFDSKNRQLIWGTIGGNQRSLIGHADILTEDDIGEIKEAVSSIIYGEYVLQERTKQVDKYLSILAAAVNTTERMTPEEARELCNQVTNINRKTEEVNAEYENERCASRGQTWFDLLRNGAEEIGTLPSVRVADSRIGDKKVRYIAVVPNAQNHFPRAKKGEVGLLEGWTIAKHVREAIELDKDSEKRTIIAIVDVPSQAYGYHEELLGIHQACAAAVDAYASARLAGHPVVSFIPGNAISGAFLSHGMQSNRLIALRDQGVNVHVMSKKSAARITLRSLEELEAVSKKIPAMAYDIESFEKLGALFSLVGGVEADHPGQKDLDLINNEIIRAIKDIEDSGITDLSVRLASPLAKKVGRKASNLVRKMMEDQWN